jgi:endonuclease/exonuclease/phosphatase (EEP) superfamily protein YafD
VRPAAALAALPWAWFVLRDSTGGVGDVLAILFPVLMAGLVLFGIGIVGGTRQPWWLAPTGSALLVGLVATLGPWLPADAGAVRPGAGVTVVGANVRESRGPVPALLRDSPDVLVISELSPRVDTALSAAYPYREVLQDGPSVGVYSRLPLRVLDRSGADLPGMRLEVDGPDGPFLLYGLHVPRPWYTSEGSGYQATLAEHRRILTVLAARIAAERQPVAVVGDLNMPDRGRDYRQLLHTPHLVDAMRDRGTRFSSVGKWTPLLLRIDHALVSSGWCGDDARQLELPGSDHRGIGVTVGPCTAAAPQALAGDHREPVAAGP